MEKRKFPYISFGVSILAMLGLIVLTVVEIVGYIELSAVAQSGAEMAPVVVFLLYFPIVAIPGAISSCYCGIKAKIIWVKVVSFIILAVCLVILFPFVAFWLRWQGVLTVIREVAIWFIDLL
ncbi:MAG: hypothetical protein E7468_08040 [Ruminococcaceae bacterium]|nr:hypothetical protein [Oscillospiraceae bacterium]